MAIGSLVGKSKERRDHEFTERPLADRLSAKLRPTGENRICANDLHFLRNGLSAVPQEGKR